MPLNVPASAKSWIETPVDSPFPIQNLPFGLACIDDETEAIVTRIGDSVIDVCELAAAGLIPEQDFPILHSFIDLDRDDLRRLRHILYDLLHEDSPRLRDDAELRECAVLRASEVEMLVPMEIPQFVDFYSGIHHASNVGKMFRPDMPPLLPNYRHVPVAYNGRASTIMPTDAPVHRPNGQYKPADADLPTFGPTQELDFELEVGYFIGAGNEMGCTVSADDAEDHMMGLVLVNDWSARDVQRWEYQPLGPFLSKSFATTISPWIVTFDALMPFRIQGPKQDPEPLEHLRSSKPGHYDIVLEVFLKTARMSTPQLVSRTNTRELYWSFSQQVAHLTSNGTSMEPGDLYASGTISGPEPGSFGSLLELTWRGTKSITFPETGENRTFLEEGDTVIFNGYAQGPGYRIGFGELRNTVN